MAEYKLVLEKRDVSGKKVKTLRAKGLIPSVVYGTKEPILTVSDYVATEKILDSVGYHSPVDLEIDGKKQMAIVKNVAFNPVSRMISNVEFQAISAREVVDATAPVVIVNFEDSEASRTYHYAMVQAIEELEVKAKPADLPEKLTIDASGMKELEDKLTISDIELPNGVEFADKELDSEQVVASIYDPASEAEKREVASVIDAEAVEVAGEESEETAASEE